MKKKTRLGHTISGFARTTVLSSLCAAATFAFSHTAMAAGNVVLAQSQDPQSLDPIDTFLVNWATFGSNIFEGLTFRDENLEIKPGLATAWEFLDDNSRIRFTLREGVTFHNGEPFNAEAVKFTFDRLLGEEGAKGPQQSNYTSIKSVEVVDDHTVDFVMATPDPVMLIKLSGYGAMIVPPKYTAEVSEEEFNKAPVGTGPFKVVSYTPSVDLKLEKYDGYWGEAAQIDTAQYRFIPEASTRVSELLSGGVDIAIDVPSSSAETIKKSDVADLVVVSGPRVDYLSFNTSEGAITADPKVRQAINLAVDKQAIVDALLNGTGKTVASLQSDMSFGYSPDLKPYAYDPAAAQALLKEAGIASGTKLTMDIRNNDDTFREVAQAVSSYLAAVGLTVELRTNETGVYYSDVVPTGKTGELYQFGWGGWTFDFDNTAYLLFHSGERWNPYIKDEKLDKMLEEQRATYDTAFREKTLQDVAAYVHDMAYTLPLYNSSAIYGVSKKIEGFIPAPDNRVRLAPITVK